MAYRTFDAPDSVFSGNSHSSDERFAPLEIKVIQLAEADPVASIGPPTRFTRFFERWFGLPRHNPLADARLEALRRFAVLVRVTGGQLPIEEIKRFLAAGFSSPQARALLGRSAGFAS